jgi:hypothetical protein
MAASAMRTSQQQRLKIFAEPVSLDGVSEHFDSNYEPLLLSGADHVARTFSSQFALFLGVFPSFCSLYASLRQGFSMQ